MMKKICAALVAAPMLLAGATPLTAQHGRRDNFYNGTYEGGRGGQYDYDRYHRNYRRGDYQRRDYQRGDYNQGYYRGDQRGGIGPGKGALIGGAGGAILGALLGGGMKGALIGGAAGAGIGAVAGKAHQDSRRRDRYGRPY